MERRRSLPLRLSSPSFCLSYKLSNCRLVEGAEPLPSLAPILSVSLRKYAVKRADYWMALKLLFCLLISPSTLLSLSILLHFLAFLTPPPPPAPPPYHLISSQDEDWWRYFLIFFTLPCCWVLSRLLCPTKRLITVLPPSAESAVSVNEGLTDRDERVRATERKAREGEQRQSAFFRYLPPSKTLVFFHGIK